MRKLFSVRTIILAGVLLLQLSTLCFHSRGAAGDVDLSFDPGSGVNGQVHALAVQPDGKVIIAGQFITMVKGRLCQNIARLNADGSGDSSFACADPNTGFSAASAVALQSDGKVLVGHDNGISRLNPDGSLDTNFIAPLIVADDLSSAGVNSVAVQADGRILIGGGFRIVNAQIRNSVARLNADGSLDDSFDSATVDGLYSGVFSIAVQSDGKVLIGGQYMTATDSSIARLNANGSLDGAFNAYASEAVRSVAVQPDGKVLIGGYFAGGVARLNANGVLDSSFNPGTGADRWIYSVALQSDGKLLIGGDFTSVSGTNRDRIARLDADGSLDGTFDPGSGPHPYIFAVAVQSDGKVLIGGADIAGDVADYNLLTRLNADGSRDGTFTAGGGVEGTVESLVVQPDGKVLICGGFIFINGTHVSNSARLNADGSLDSTFNTGVVGGVVRIELQPDGKLLIGGWFADQNGTNLGGIARLNADGSLDRSFNPGTGADNVVVTLALQSDGKVLIGGDFETVNGTNRNRIARLNTGGSLDGTFNPNLAPDSSVIYIAAQPDGKVLVGGDFSIVGGINRYLIARLNADGSLDTSFNPGTGLNRSVSSVALQPDGKVLINSGFTAVNGTNLNQIVRLNADGGLDSSFNPVTDAGGFVRSIALQLDGKVLIGGSFSLLNGTIYSKIARLNANGSLDNSFNPGRSAGYVLTIALQPDGKMLICGDFTTVNGVVRPHVARLYGDSVTPSLNIARSNAFVIVSWPSPSTGFELQQNTNLNPVNWTTPSETVTDNGTTRSITVSPALGNRFYRLFKP